VHVNGRSQIFITGYGLCLLATIVD